MLKKIYTIIFICLFLAVLAIPLALTDFSSGGVSVDENRNLATFPQLTVDGKFNQEFTSQFETWFMDHVGLREKLINLNAFIQFKCFDRMLDKSDYMIGRNGDINYATDEMLQDYLHLNLRPDDTVGRLGDAFQAVSDHVEKTGAAFYYVQCYDKHSIYPEDFISTMKPVGDISKTDQVITYLENSTSVTTISLKPILLEAKADYPVFSSWGDPTHWSERGAYIGYCHVMQTINQDFDGQLKILQEDDYNISMENVGITLNKVIHEDDYQEKFEIKNPKAKKTDISVMGEWVDETWHSVWENPEAGNDLKLLIMGDSYFNSYIVDDFAESFSSVWFIWADYTADLADIVAAYQPDIVIYECAERADRCYNIYALAQTLPQS